MVTDLNTISLTIGRDCAFSVCFNFLFSEGMEPEAFVQSGGQGRDGTHSK